MQSAYSLVSCNRPNGRLHSQAYKEKVRNKMSSSHQQVAYEIDAGSIWLRTNTGRYWRVRRNGATKLWKRNIFRYLIPVKAGLNVYAKITNETEIGPFDSDYQFIARVDFASLNQLSKTGALN
jgi:hypothetical protein